MKKLAFPILVLFVILQAPATGMEITLSEELLERGKPVTITLNDAGLFGNYRLQVVYLPNSATERTEMIGSFTLLNTIRWTPESAGIVTLKALNSDGVAKAELNKAIRYPELPWLGVLVMILAGILLFGGAGISLKQALRKVE